MDTDATPAGTATSTESAHTTSRKSAPTLRVDLIPRGERRRRWNVHPDRHCRPGHWRTGRYSIWLYRPEPGTVGTLHSRQIPKQHAVRRPSDDRECEP